MQTTGWQNDWDRARQFVDIVERPADWIEQVRERIDVKDDDISRHVSLRLTPPRRRGSAPYTEILVPLLKPRKRIAQALDILAISSGSARVLTHDEHSRLVKWLIIYRFRSLVSEATFHGLLTWTDRPFLQEIVTRLLALVDSAPRSEADLDPLADVFDADGWLLHFPKLQAPSLDFEMNALFGLCQELVDRYYKVALISGNSGPEVLIDYVHQQEREARLYGNVVMQALRRWFRAPGSSLLLHIPLSRSTTDYELRVGAVDGYWVSEQLVLEGDKNEAEYAEDRPSGAAVSRPPNNSHTDRKYWWSTPRGGQTSATVFVGNGVSSPERLYVGIRLLETPPGATGRAFATTGLGSLVIVSLFIWAIFHTPRDSSLAPELLAALVALGSAVVDNVTPTRELFNAPLGPRFALIVQTLAALGMALWLLARGAADDLHLPATGPIRWFLIGLGRADLWIGAALTLTVVAAFISLLVRSAQAAFRFNRAMAMRNR